MDIKLNKCTSQQRTTASGHLADASVAPVGHEHVTTCIDGQLAEKRKTGVGPVRVDN
jgi:hypothetical protein